MGLFCYSLRIARGYSSCNFADGRDEETMNT